MRYKTHREVDPEHEVITATLVTLGSIDERAVIQEVIEVHEQNTNRKVKTAVAGSRHGTIENFLFSRDSGIQVHIPSLEESQRGAGRREDIFPKEAFTYRSDRDGYICLGGKVLKRWHFYIDRRHYEYKLPPVFVPDAVFVRSVRDLSMGKRLNGMNGKARWTEC